MVQPVVRPLGYTGSLQQLIWDQGDNVLFRAYLFGGGGGAGGTSYINGIGTFTPGGTGLGGGYAFYQGYVNTGDVLWCSVGGAGGGGGTGYAGIPGSAGKSYVYQETAPPVAPIQAIPTVPGVPPVTGTPGYAGNGFYTVTTTNNTNPVSKEIRWWYVVQDGVITYKSYVRPPYNYSGGTYRGSVGSYSGFYPHEYRAAPCVTNAFDLQGLATGQSSFSGGRGGWAGTNVIIDQPGVYSASPGGGGGGATVLMLNNTVIGVAGGGGGGGGGGMPAVNSNAPGSTFSAYPVTNGQNGASSTSNQAGGGGGGGGWGGGDGGFQGGFSGSFSNALGGNAGGGHGANVINPNSTISAGSLQPYWNTLGRSIAGNGAAASGSNGQAGMAVVEFYPVGMYVKNSSMWQPIQQVWVKSNDTWQRPGQIYIKQDGEWKLVWGSYAPPWEALEASFGELSRPYNGTEPLEPPHDGGGEYGGGGGGDQDAGGGGGGADGGGDGDE